jgi:hypothetical protein
MFFCACGGKGKGETGGERDWCAMFLACMWGKGKGRGGERDGYVMFLARLGGELSFLFYILLSYCFLRNILKNNHQTLF